MTLSFNKGSSVLFFFFCPQASEFFSHVILVQWQMIQQISSAATKMIFKDLVF